MSDSSPP